MPVCLRGFAFVFESLWCKQLKELLFLWLCMRRHWDRLCMVSAIQFFDRYHVVESVLFGRLRQQISLMGDGAHACFCLSVSCYSHFWSNRQFFVEAQLPHVLLCCLASPSVVGARPYISIACMHACMHACRRLTA